MRLISGFITLVQHLVVLTLFLFVSACGGDWGGGGTTPSITILNPTSSSIYETTSTGVGIGGRISGSGTVDVINTTTGNSHSAYVTYNADNIGSWFADVTGLVPGDNLITVTAYDYNDHNLTAVDSITIRRPLQPLSLIINAADSASATDYWTDMHSFNASHSLAIFADGTGISTTGNVLSEDAGAIVTFTWSIVGPDAIQVNNCPTCSFQQITRISGSLGEQQFLGQVETINGDGQIALHAFFLNPGTL